MQKRWWSGLAAAVVVVGVVVATRHALIRFGLEQAIGIATGYTVRIGDQRLGRDHGAFLDVHVSRNGEPVLDATRIDLYYSLRELLPGSTHRFGVTGVAIASPAFTALRHRDGTYNIILPTGSAATSGPPGRPNGVPFRFTVRVRDGSAILVDQVEYAKDHSRQRVLHIDADATVDSSARTHYVASGDLEDVKPEPFRAVGTVDLLRGYAIHHLQAKAVPIRTIGNFIMNSPALKILAGTAHDVDARVYSLDVAPNVPIVYHVGASLDVADGQLFVASLAQPLDRITGRLQIVDDQFFSRRLGATLAGVPVLVAGGLFDFAAPQLRFGLTGRGDLAKLRGVLGFARAQPVRGDARLGVLIEGSTADPVVVAHADAARAYYRDLPLDDVHADVALAHGVVYVAPMLADYAGVRTIVRGSLTLGKPVASLLAIHADASSDDLPYIAELLPHEPMAADAVLRGNDVALGAHGSLASTRDVARASALFTFAPNGVAEVAPFHISSGAGSVTGRYRLDRPTGTSAFWAVAQNVGLHAPGRTIFPGARLPQLPPISGTLGYAAVVGGGSGANVVLAGRLSAAQTTVADVRFDSIAATFGGDLSNASISRAHADGPWGNFDGTGAFSPRGIAARGSYAGTLQGLHPFLGGISGSGAVSGPIAISIEPDRIVVQAQDVAFADAQLDGVAIQRASGTLAYEKGALHIYSADATVANGHLVAAGDYASAALGGGTIALVGVGLHGAGLHGLGLPLQSGDVAVAGRLGDGGGTTPSFDGGVSVKNGRAQGYPVSGSASLALHDGTLHIANGVGTLGTAAGLVGGTIDGLAAHVPRYAVHADVPAADVASTLQTLHLPGYQTTGVFNADLAIGGSGAWPVVAGPVAVPGGTVNGLPFVDASARLDADRAGLSARYGGALVGTTGVRFSAIARKDENAISVRAPHATLSDFNNFFDTGDTLDGVGAIAFSVLAGGGHVSTDGDVNVKGFRYRALPIGDTIASWSSVRNVVNGRLAVSGAHGSLHVAGDVVLAPATRMDRLIADSRYDATATVDDMDLSTWLPAVGYPELPLLGRVDASARVRGAYPHLHVVGEANLTNGSFGRLPIDSMTASVGSNGDSIVLQNAEVTAPAFAATASGTLGLTKTMPLALSVHAVTDDLPLLIAQLTRTNVAVKGSFETTAQIGGTLGAPTFQAAFDASGVDAYGLVASSIFGSVKLVGRNLELRNAGATFAHGEATLAGTLPLRLSPFEVVNDQPVNFDLALSGVDPGALDEVLGNGTKLGGSLDGHVNLVGTLQQPRIYGRISIAKGTYVSALERVGVTGTVGTITFDRTSASLDGFSAQFGTGRVQATGKIAFNKGFGTLGDVNYRIDALASGAQLDLPAYGRGTIDGRLALARTPPGLATLSGAVSASNAVIPFSAFFGGGSTAAGGAQVAGLPIDLGLNLKVTATQNVRVRGGGVGSSIDIGATGSALLAGTLSQPTLDGSFTSTNGTLTYFDRAFRLQSGTVSFDPADGVSPVLHAVGVTHIVNPDPNRSRNPYGSADITIKVDGPVSGPTVAFESNPPGYSRDQILALIAPFGGFIGSGIAFDPITGQPTGPPAPGNLPGAPLANTGQALPGVLVPQANGTITIGQEAFNILNAQFTSGLIAPIENALSEGLGLDSLSLTVDYYGNVGVDVRRKVGKYLNAIYATTFGIPTRTSVGLEYAPNDSTSAQLSAFFESGATRLVQTPGAFGSSSSRLTAGQALQGSSGFTFTLQRLFW